MRRRVACAAVALLAALPALAGGSTEAKLSQFTAANVPALGPGEEAIPRNWSESAPPGNHPGRGLAQHPMLYAGEGYNDIFLVDGGKVIWNYFTGTHGEVDDIWLLSNGNILFAKQWAVEEVTPRKQIVWHYDAPKGTEIHTCQPIGLHKVLFIENGLPPRLIVMDKRSNKILVEHTLPAESLTDPKTIHPQFRRVRITSQGTYLVPSLRMNKVIEYDRHFNPVWTYDVRTPWAAVRLHNGNTLITDEHDKTVLEVSPQRQVVWKFSPSDLPADVTLHNTQTANRLANGNTVIFSSTGGTKHAQWPDIIQVLEVTPDKKLVWVLQDWKDLGPATTAQFLDQPGRPEKPGALQR